MQVLKPNSFLAAATIDQILGFYFFLITPDRFCVLQIGDFAFLHSFLHKNQLYTNKKT